MRRRQYATDAPRTKDMREGTKRTARDSRQDEYNTAPFYVFGAPAMSKKRLVIPEKLKPWIEARARHKLSHAQIQMARELGMNPRKFGSIANHDQEKWKVPLPEFIQACYEKQFKRRAPENVRSIEQKLEDERAKKALKSLAKAEARSKETAPDSLDDRTASQREEC